MRLTGGVTDFGHAFCACRREERRLGPCDRRFVQIHRRRRQTIRRFEMVPGSGDDARAHADERVEMRRDGAPRRKIAARLRKPRAPASRQQRTEQ